MNNTLPLDFQYAVDNSAFYQDSCLYALNQFNTFTAQMNSVYSVIMLYTVLNLALVGIILFVLLRSNKKRNQEKPDLVEKEVNNQTKPS